ncbi:MAG: hypothetical protein AB7H97_03925 [Pseudobdellovibrionaceae bacterium]
MKILALVTLGLLGFSSQSHSRVFSLSNEGYAPYLRGSGGMAPIKQAAFKDSDGAGASVEEEVTTNMSGELGLALTFSKASLRIGYEALAPSALTDVKAKNAGGDVLYTMKSSSLVTVPKLSLDLHLRQWQESRVIMFFTASYPKITMSNSYAMTTDGNTAYPGLEDYLEEGTQQTIGYEAGVGFETLMADTTTLTLDVGYRTLKFANMTHVKPHTNFAGTAIVKGDPVINNDGSKRSLDFSGYFASLTLKIYVKTR